MRSIGNVLGDLFQIQDDYLDLYGKRSYLGKVIGGDVLEMKKTFLYITAFQNANSKQKQELEGVYHSSHENKIDIISQYYNDLRVQECVQQTINNLSQTLIKLITSIGVPNHQKEIFSEFITAILSRKA